MWEILKDFTVGLGMVFSKAWLDLLMSVKFWDFYNVGM